MKAAWIAVSLLVAAGSAQADHFDPFASMHGEPPKPTGTNQVWRQDGPMKFPVQLTGGEDATKVVALAPDETFLVLSRDVGGAEDPALYVMDPAGGALRTVLHAPKVRPARSSCARTSPASTTACTRSRPAR